MKFMNLAKDDSCFAESMFEEWEYNLSFNFRVNIYFLDEKGDGGYVHKLTNYFHIDGIPVATPVDLAIGKNTTWVEREHHKDFTGLQYAVGILIWYRLNFGGLGQQSSELLEDIREQLRESAQGRQLVQHISALV